MNKKHLLLAVAALFSISTLSACGGGSDDEKEPSNGGGGAVALPDSVKGLQLTRCETLDSTSGTGLTGKVVTKYLTLAANGTYTYQVWYGTSSACIGQAGSATGGGQVAQGGNETFRYNQAGTYTASTMATDGSYTISFVVTSNVFTARTTGDGPAMVMDVNSNCTLGMSGGSDTTVSNSTTCLNGSGGGHLAYLIATPPPTSITMTQRLEITTRGIKMGTPSSLFEQGPRGTTAPTTAATTYLTYL